MHFPLISGVIDHNRGGVGQVRRAGGGGEGKGLCRDPVRVIYIHP